MRQSIEVRKIASGAFKGAFEVVVQYRPLMEDMFETVCYGDVFESPLDAERLVERIKAKAAKLPFHQTVADALDFAYWLWMPTQASCDGRLHRRPTHVRKFIHASEYQVEASQ